MKLLFENWRSYINEQENEPASEITDPEVAERTQKAATEIQQLKQQLEEPKKRWNAFLNKAKEVLIL